MAIVSVAQSGLTELPESWKSSGIDGNYRFDSFAMSELHLVDSSASTKLRHKTADVYNTQLSFVWPPKFVQSGFVCVHAYFFCPRSF